MSRISVCGRGQGLDGDLTTTGATCISSLCQVRGLFRAVLRKGDKTTPCPICLQIGEIIDGESSFILHGIPSALDDARIQCGCPLGSNRLIAPAAGNFHSSPPLPQTVPAPTPITTSSPATAFAPAPLTRHRDTVDELEEEEEEEEIEQGQLITLRVGVFFDGTGNNQSNSESVIGCRASDVGLGEQMPDIRQFCIERGFTDDGKTPEDSYGNDTSNVARLYDLYEDQVNTRLKPDADKASLKIYLEGIGTVSGGADSLYSQGTGRGDTGVLARVHQAPPLLIERLLKFTNQNAGIKIQRIEVDIFGFSRGAAAARHFANDLLKGAGSLLAAELHAGSPALKRGFKWRARQDILINFIGLFDTVAAIVAPLQGDFSPGNAKNAGLNLGLADDAARKIVQLVARDEHRLNFALTRTGNDIVLPGSHSDIGGGYLPIAREHLLLSKPISSLESVGLDDLQSQAFHRAKKNQDPWLSQLIRSELVLRVELWSVDQPRTRDQLQAEKKVYAAVKVEREVRGDLSKVYLRIMRDLGVRHGVPFDTISDQDSRLALPAEILPVARKLHAYALGESSETGLTEAEESLLINRYIHLSANWNAAKGFNQSDMDLLFLNRPATHNQRVIHANE